MRKIFISFLLATISYAQISVGGSTTLTADKLTVLSVVSATPAAVATYTTDTAVNLCLYGGQSRFMIIVNSGLGVITVAPGTGVTTSGTLTISGGTSRLFIMFPTSCAPNNWTWTIQSLGSFSSF